MVSLLSGGGTLYINGEKVKGREYLGIIIPAYARASVHGSLGTFRVGFRLVGQGLDGFQLRDDLFIRHGAEVLNEGGGLRVDLADKFFLAGVGSRQPHEEE
jgi:hypothetical protein